MKLKTPFSIIKNALSDIQVMHDINYEIPTETREEFWVDEAEFVIFTSIGAIFNQIELVLWILAVSQILIAFWRLFERTRI